MLTISSLLERVKSLNTDKVIDESFDETTEDLKVINQDRMLAGVKADGTVMPNYSDRSVIEFGKEPGPIKLFDKGDFQQSITVKREGDVLLQKSADWKNDMLVREYGNIFGTYGPYKKEYQKENLEPVIKRKISSVTGLKFK